jgi:hypothetical protein
MVDSSRWSVKKHTGHPSRIKEKQKATSLKNYGVPYSSQNKNIALKAAKSSSNSQIKFHWKTGEELTCMASFEAFVVDYFNINKIEFEWQSRVFEMPDGRTYRPDLYLIKENTWIEIKGWMRKDAQEKWDWFRKEYPNSDLWNERKLKSMGFKYKKKIVKR